MWFNLLTWILKYINSLPFSPWALTYVNFKFPIKFNVATNILYNGEKSSELGYRFKKQSVHRTKKKYWKRDVLSHQTILQIIFLEPQNSKTILTIFFHCKSTQYKTVNHIYTVLYIK